MLNENDLQSIASVISLADAYISCRPEKPCAVSASLLCQPDVQTENQNATGTIQDASSIASAAQEQNPVGEISASQTQESPRKQMTVSDIALKISRCNRCRLCQGRTNTVPGMGVENPLVLVIGEGPGADEDASGRPFVGKAGQLLDRMLAAISLSRETNCFIANIVKCRPPENRDPMPEEADACRSFLDAQISILKPKLILTVGRIAVQNLLNISTGITRLHGQFLEYKGIPVLPTYHPSALLRNPELKKPAWEDLKIFRARLEEITGLSFTTPSSKGNSN